MGDLGDVEKHHDQAGQDIDSGHDGYQLLSNRANALDAADEHDANDNHQDDRQDDVNGHLLLRSSGDKGLDSGIDGVSDVAHLHRVADTEGGEAAKHTEDDTQPFPVLTQAILDIVHRAADPVTLGVALTEFHRQQHLGVLGRHAQQGRDPQPEDGAGAAQGDGGGDPGDVAGTHGGRQGGGQGLEGCDLALLGRLLGKHLANGVLHGVAELPELEPLEPHRQNDACAHEQHQGGYAPYDVVQPTVAGCDRVINLIHTLSPYNMIYIPENEKGEALPPPDSLKIENNYTTRRGPALWDYAAASVLLPERLRDWPFAPSASA